MRSALQDEIRELRTRYWSDRDPSGRAFAPLADAYRRAGELDEAADLVEEGVSRLPDYAPGHLVAARILRDRGDVTGAAGAYERVLELDPENLEALRGAARLREEEGRTGEALELWQRLLRAEPDEAGLIEHVRDLKRRHFGLAGSSGPPTSENGVSEAAGDDDGGDGEDGSSDDDPAELYTRTMAELYARQGLPERAVAVYRKLLERDPEDPELRARIEELERQASEEPEPSDEADAAPTEDPATAPADDAADDIEPGPPESSGDEVGPGEPARAEPGRPPTPAGDTAGAYFRRMLAWPDAREPGG